MTSSFRLPALLVVAAMLLGACATAPATPAGPVATEPQTGGTLRVAIEQENAAYHPCVSTASFSASFINVAIYDSLLQRDAKGVYQPLVADSLTPDADGKVWTAKLKKGITYHDGTPLNAASVKATIDEIRAPACFSAGSYAVIDKVEAPDDSTVVVTLKAGNVWFTQTIGTMLLFKPGLVAQLGKEAGSKPIGTGPFKLVSWERDQQLTVERNPNYWRKDAKGRQLPHLGKIVFRPIPNADTRLSSLRSGDLDTIMSTDPAILAKSDELGLTVNYLTGNSGLMWYLNGTNPPTNDARVRRALALATDKAAIVNVMGGGPKYSQIMNQWYAPTSSFFSKKVDEAWPKRDLAKAKAELQSYMNDPARSDKKPVGSPVSVTIYSRNLQQQQAMDQVQQAQWKEAGVDAQVKTAVEATFLDDVRKGNYEAALFNFGDNDPYTQLVVFLPESGSRYFSKYNHPQLTQKLAVLQRTPQEKAPPVLEDIWLFLEQEMPIIPLSGNFMGMISSKGVQNGPFILALFLTDWTAVWTAK